MSCAHCFELRIIFLILETSEFQKRHANLRREKKPSCRYRIGLVSFKETFSNKLYIFIDLNFYSRYDFAFFMYFIWRKIWLEKVGIVGRYINYLWIPSAGWKEKKSSNCVPGHGSQSSTLLLLLITIGNCFYFRWCFHF